MHWNYKKAFKRLTFAFIGIPLFIMGLILAFCFGIILQILAMLVTVVGFFVWLFLYLLGFDDEGLFGRSFNWLWDGADEETGHVFLLCAVFNDVFWDLKIFRNED
jgi:type IV secretory pathway VirB3-like protein